jgi:hypothetical protein
VVRGRGDGVEVKGDGCWGFVTYGGWGCMNEVF